MSKKLVLAEKPSVARELGKVLGCNRKSNSFLEGNKYVIVWGLGHLVELEPPEHYDNKYKTWNLESLPIIPKKFDLAVIKKTSKHFYATKNVFKRNDLDELIIATDAGREGELVARWIMEKAGWKKPVKRLWISSQTSKAIREGFNKLKDGKSYENLYYSAKSRAIADWVVGLNITRALTCKYNAQLSAGRVQTPTLNMIVKREEEIRNFKPVPYYEIHITGKDISFIWQDKNNNQRIYDKDNAEKIIDKTKNKTAKIINIKKTEKKELHPLLYDLTELQRDANRKYGFSPKETLNILQGLYESHKLVSYPRTDSRYISDDIVPTLKERLSSINIGPYRELIKNIVKKPLKATKRFVDNSKVTDHHALIPTEEYVSLEDLEANERKIYDLIVLRFISVFYNPYEYEQTVITADIEGECFKASGKTETSIGWKQIYKNQSLSDDEDTGVLPPYSVNDDIDIKIYKIKRRQNQTTCKI
jgi:DNA topoisomerase-3